MLSVQRYLRLEVVHGRGRRFLVFRALLLFDPVFNEVSASVAGRFECALV